MRGLEPAIKSIQRQVGGSSTTKEAIINASSSSEDILKRTKEVEKSKLKEKNKEQRLEFKPEDIERIVMNARKDVKEDR